MFSTQSISYIPICRYLWHHIFICCWTGRAQKLAGEVKDQPEIQTRGRHLNYFRIKNKSLRPLKTFYNYKIPTVQSNSNFLWHWSSSCHCLSVCLSVSLSLSLSLSLRMFNSVMYHMWLLQINDIELSPRVTRHNSADSVPRLNLLYIKEVAIRTTFYIAGIIYYTCNFIIGIQCTP